MNPEVTFLPEKVTVSALPGNNLLELSREAGIPIAADCGGAGTCGRCRVIVTPPPDPSSLEKKLVSPEDLERGVRLACRVRVRHENLSVLVPPESRLLELKTLVTGASREITPDPGVRKFFLQLAPPDIEDQRDDWTRVRNALAGRLGGDPAALSAGLELLRALPVTLRESSFRVTAAVSGHELLALEGGDTVDRCFGVAFDLGTTSIAGALLDLDTASEKAAVAEKNPQAAWGADVISRINHTILNPRGGGELARAAAGALNGIISKLCRAARVKPENIYQVTVAGNTVMQHLLLQVPCGALAVSPYVGACHDALTLPAAALALRVNPAARLFVAPAIGGFVGGDTVAGILATNIHCGKSPRLFVDIGTNGEIVAGGSRELWCAATAAGPAFEGSAIRHGMRAEAGAIDKVKIGARVAFTTIGGGPARGLCGTGLLESVGELLRVGLINSDGALVTDGPARRLPDAVLERLGEKNGEKCFLLCPETGVALYQRDIRQLQLAKAAIAAGIEILLAKLGLEPGDLSEILLAGAFGSYIEPRYALLIGLLPGARARSIRFVGNTALGGARMMLASEAMKNEARQIAQNCRYLELFHEKSFSERFLAHLAFPPQVLP